jgi:hypothetical protein
VTIDDGAKAYESLGAGQLNFLFSNKEDCASGRFSYYFLKSPVTCGQGPEGVCVSNSTWVPTSTYKARYTVYTGADCATVQSSGEADFESLKCHATNDNDVAQFQTVMYQGF